MKAEDTAVTNDKPLFYEEGGKRGMLSLYAVFLFIASYLFLSILPISTAPLGFLVISISVYIITAVIARLLGGGLCFASIVSFVFGIGAAAFRFFHGAFGHELLTGELFPSFTLCGAAYVFFTLSLFNNHSRALNGGFLLDICKGIAYLFASFADMFKVLFGRGSTKSRRSVLVIVFGVIIAALLLIAVGSLLSYDEHFSSMLPRIDLENIPGYFVKILVSVPLSAMLFSLLASSKKKLLPGLSSEPSREGIANSIRIVPPMLLAIPACAVLILYVMFFISQWGYYVSAFTHKLPAGYSAAEYARDGFFQLLAVACINAVLILALGCLSRKTGRGEERLIKIMSVLLCAATLVLIATAISKMLLYIDMYDLTRSRLIASGFLVFLAISFSIVIIAVLIPKMKAMPFIVAAGLAIVFVYSVVNTDKMIADYNAEAYLSGRHANIDIEYLSDNLKVNALDSLERLHTESSDIETANKALNAAEEIRAEIRSRSVEWYEYDLPYLIAKGK